MFPMTFCFLKCAKLTQCFWNIFFQLETKWNYFALSHKLHNSIFFDNLFNFWNYFKLLLNKAKKPIVEDLLIYFSSFYLSYFHKEMSFRNNWDDAQNKNAILFHIKKTTDFSLRIISGINCSWVATYWSILLKCKRSNNLKTIQELSGISQCEIGSIFVCEIFDKVWSIIYEKLDNIETF